MTSQAALGVERSVLGASPCIAPGTSEVAALAQETAEAATAMTAAVGKERQAALLQYKQAMRRLVWYLSANSATEHRVRF